MKNVKSLGFVVGLGLLMASAGALAQSAASDWRWELQPYVWAASFKGNVSPFRYAPEMQVSKPFSKIVGDVNFGGFIEAVGRRGRWMVMADVMYLSTRDSRSVHALPMVGSVQNLGGSLDSKQFTGTLGVGWRLAEADGWHLDASVAARYWHISNKATLFYQSVSRHYRESFHWVDPVVGLGLGYAFAPGWSVQAQGDIGGFGLGASHTWRVAALLTHDFSAHLGVSLGYKMLKVDYRSGGHVFDATMKGPTLALKYRF